MSKRVLRIDWKSIDGALVKRRVLHLNKNADGIYLCPIEACLHVGFRSNRGLRKHINNTHPWYYYFNEQPVVSREEAVQQSKIKLKASTHNMPAFSLDNGVGMEFLQWLQTACGGGKGNRDSGISSHTHK